MNTEYMKVTPNLVMVTNEYGRLQERKIDCVDIERELVLENNLDYINKIIKDLEEFIDSKHPFDKDKYLASIEIALMATLPFAAVGTLYNHDVLPTLAFGFGGAWAVASVIYTGISNASYLNDIKHKKEAYKFVLEKAKEIRDNIINETNNLEKYTEPNNYMLNISTPIFRDALFELETEKTLNEEYQNNVTKKRLKNELPL